MDCAGDGRHRLDGGFVNEDTSASAHWRWVRGLAGRRWARAVAEAGYDAGAWLTGMFGAALAIRGAVGEIAIPAVWPAVAAVPLVTAGCGMLAGLYRGRHLRGSPAEVIGVLMSVCSATLALSAIGAAVAPGDRFLLKMVTGGAAFTLPAMLGARYVAFAARLRRRPASPSAVKVLVFGAGDAGTQLVHRLMSQRDSRYRPVGILDDNPAKRRLRIHGIPVLGDRTRMAEAAAATGAKTLVIAIARASGPVIRDITAAAERCGLTPKVIPSITELLSGCASIEGVRDPRISDLLGRRPVKTDIAAVAGHFAGKRILVTGAGGSIGSELCRQLHCLSPAELIMLDRDESALHAVQLQLHGRALLDSRETVLADIRDPGRIREVFEALQPQIVFHAAALKHLPLLERYPAEAVKTNVWGTLNVLEAAAACGTEAFVNISTDKAASPVSVLGYSKRIAERLTAWMAEWTGRQYLSVRFGNVLGSRGSVLTSLSAQVAAGGPVTVTHPEVSRYFMTAGEAVQLVLQAAVIGRGGEVLVLDMGEPVRIADIAHRLIAHSQREIAVVYTGLRPGEKLHEDLLGEGERDERPHHPLIRHTPVEPLRPDQVIAFDPAACPSEVCEMLAAAAAADGGSRPEAQRASAPQAPGALVQPLVR
jgi:FlaA1/EpsC-like NDP-sugar epimerase